MLALSNTAPDAGLRLSRKMVAASAAFTLTGSASGLVAARNMAAEGGAFVLTGQDVTLTYAPIVPDYVMAASSGAFVLSGLPVEFKVRRFHFMPARRGAGKQSRRDTNSTPMQRNAPGQRIMRGN